MNNWLSVHQAGSSGKLVNPSSELVLFYRNLIEPIIPNDLKESFIAYKGYIIVHVANQRERVQVVCDYEETRVTFDHFVQHAISTHANPEGTS